MKHKWIKIRSILTACILSLTVLIAVGGSVGRVLFYTIGTMINFNKEPSPITITEGFSDKVLNLLNNQYDITIPENAHYCEGYYHCVWNDGYIGILFECPIDETQEIEPQLEAYLRTIYNLGPGETMAASKGDIPVHAVWFQEMGGPMDYYIPFNDFGGFGYKIDGNRILFKFLGWRPNVSFD